MLAGCVSACAQSADTQRLKPVPPVVAPAPFGVEASAMDASRGIEFVAAESMSETDRRLAELAEGAIAEQAARVGIDFAGGGWSREQIVCPALPNHLFVRSMRAEGTGSESSFSVSIPRGGEGKVRVIAIRRKGYSLFSPAPVNAMTISTFNHIRAEEPETQRTQGWLGNGLCYAALAGARPRVPEANAEPAVEHPVPALDAVLCVKNGDGEVVQFVDEAAAPKPMLWTMNFTEQGKLVKASHEAASSYTLRPVPGKVEVKELPVAKAVPVLLRPVPQVAEAALRNVPPAQSATLRPVPPIAQPVLKPVPAAQ